MKKYRLIREYPGSPELNSIGYPNDNHMNTTAIITPKDFRYFTSKLIEFEKHPEFWKPIIEKDYEILSFIGNNITLTWSKQKDGNFTIINNIDVKNKGVHNQQHLIDQGLKIKSVKRLSDGEVFTVGDSIVIHSGYKVTKKIIEFYITKANTSKLRAKTSDDGGYVELASFEKAKQKLFTTEDRVDIFEGDMMYWANRTCIEHIFSGKATKDMHTTDIYLNFSTKEKAEEYIIMNKPCLSINDVKYMYPLTEYAKLKQLVKQKVGL